MAFFIRFGKGRMTEAGNMYGIDETIMIYELNLGNTLTTFANLASS
jgi:hypothetical protein